MHFTSPPLRPLALAFSLLGLTFALISTALGLLLPLLWPPSLQAPLYAKAFPFFLAFGLLSPYLLLGGLSWNLSSSASALTRTFTAIFGAELFLVGLGLLALDILNVFQMGWLNLPLSLEIVKTLPGLFLAPGLLALGAGLLLRPSLRDPLGILLTTLSWQALIFFGLALLYLQIVPNLLPLSKKLPTSPEIRSLGLSVAGFVLVSSALGTFLMSRDLRFRLHLLFLAPLWLPLFVIFFFWSLLINTTLYFINDLFSLSLQPSRPAKILVWALPSLLLFPLLLLFDFSKGLTYQMGSLAFQRLQPHRDDQPALSPSPFWCYSLGLLAFFTLPLWLLPAILFLAVKTFIYDAILMQIRRRLHLPSSRKS